MIGVIVVYGVSLSVKCSVERVIKRGSRVFIVVEYSSVLSNKEARIIILLLLSIRVPIVRLFNDV